MKKRGNYIQQSNTFKMSNESNTAQNGETLAYKKYKRNHLSPLRVLFTFETADMLRLFCRVQDHCTNTFDTGLILIVRIFAKMSCQS